MAHKTLLALGGSHLLMPVIDSAHALGHRVVTCDYLPNNYAHQFSDEYRNVSIVDREAVLTTAREVGADGIVSFAADPGVLSAAYATEKLGLPKQVSFSTAVTLQTKHLFREFLAHHGLPTPQAWLVQSAHELRTVKNATFPVIVKPTDAAGSKGVTRVDHPNDLRAAVDHAIQYSLSSSCIIETYIDSDTPQRSAEAFAVDGTFEAVYFMDQVFDLAGHNPYAPAGNILPDSMPEGIRKRILTDLQRIADILEFGSGIFNVEVRVSKEGVPHIVELSPRGGGNRLAEFIQAATGQNLVTATVQAALGDTVNAPRNEPPNGFWLQEMLYSNFSGQFQSLLLRPEFERDHLQDATLWITPGDHVQPFTHASFAFGTAVSKFQTRNALYAHLAADDLTIQIASDGTEAPR